MLNKGSFLPRNNSSLFPFIFCAGSLNENYCKVSSLNYITFDIEWRELRNYTIIRPGRIIYLAYDDESRVVGGGPVNPNSIGGRGENRQWKKNLMKSAPVPTLIS